MKMYLLNHYNYDTIFRKLKNRFEKYQIEFFISWDKKIKISDYKPKVIIPYERLDYYLFKVMSPVCPDDYNECPPIFNLSRDKGYYLEIEFEDVIVFKLFSTTIYTKDGIYKYISIPINIKNIINIKNFRGI